MSSDVRKTPGLTGSSITLLLVRLSSEILLVTSTINILPPFLMMHMGIRTR